MSEFINRVILSGKLRQWKIEDDRAYGLLDVGLKSAVNITAHKDEERAEKGLMENLRKFDKGDTMTFKGFVRPWGQKQENGEWKNGIEIRICALKPDCIPNRQAKQDAPDGW